VRSALRDRRRWDETLTTARPPVATAASRGP
jgi:hypothetical protein